jgi:hypothetical protein
MSPKNVMSKLTTTFPAVTMLLFFTRKSSKISCDEQRFQLTSSHSRHIGILDGSVMRRRQMSTDGDTHGSLTGSRTRNCSFGTLWTRQNELQTLTPRYRLHKFKPVYTPESESNDSALGASCVLCRWQAPICRVHTSSPTSSLSDTGTLVSKAFPCA